MVHFMLKTENSLHKKRLNAFKWVSLKILGFVYDIESYE